MKKSLVTTLIFSVIMILAMPVYAALSDYTFMQTGAQYTELPSPTVIHSTVVDDAMSPAIDIGFTFVYDDMPYTQFKSNSNGFITLDLASTASLTNALATRLLILGGLWDDLKSDDTNAGVSYQLMGAAPNRALYVQYKNMKWYYNASPVNLINFQIVLYESTNIINFVYGTMGAAPGTTASASIGISGAAAGNYVSVTPATPMASASSTAEFTAINGTHVPYIIGNMYVFMPPVAVPNDLQALSITGETAPTAGSPETYNVSIRNRGTAAQTTYTVKLMSGATELASVAGPAIQPGEILQVPVSYTFTVTGPTTIFGKVVLAGDANPDNDATAPITVNVQAANVVPVTIGAGDQVARMPIDFYWKNSLYECIYLASEINLGGLLTGVAFYNNFTSTELAAGKPTKIWIGETTATDLSAGWIPSTQLTQVYDGLVSYPVGQNTIIVTFATPYTYTGGNLVMMVNRPMDTEYFDSTDNFACQTIGTARSRKLQSDTVTYDPAAPATATPTGQFPKTTLFFVVSGMGAIQGTVTVGGNPLADAVVSVVGTSLTQTTGPNGTYSFPYVPMGPQQVSCSIVGYAPQTANVTVIENQIVTQDFVMVTLPTINVTGRVVGSDAPTVGLADAAIELTGTMNYSGTTNATGYFTITGVLGSSTYSYTISKPGYSPATGSITVAEVAYDMQTITLNEVAFPPSGVQAVEAAPNVNITWTAPNPNVQNFEDGFETYADFTLDFAPWTTIDVDLSTTYAYTGYVWTGQFDAQSFMVFNPNTTSPAFPTTIMTTHAGSKMASCWASVTPPNNDWLISPSITVPANGVVKFWARSLTDEYGLERFKVGVSTTGTAPADFTIISGGTYIQTPIVWTEYTYQLNTYAGQDVKIGINCVSNDAFCFFVDDFFLGTPARTAVTKIARIQPSTASAPKTNARVTGAGYVNNKIIARIPSSKSVFENTNNYNTRELTGYKVWRLLEGQEDNEAAWTMLTPNIITATAYQDMGWNSVADGNYKWAVKAVYTGNVMSTPALSNMIPKVTQIGTIAGIVSQSGNIPIVGATITAGTYSATSNATGAYSMQVPAGTYTVNCSAAGFVPASHDGIVVVTGVTTQVNFILAVSALVTDGFETYTDFAIDFAPWINVDVDQSGTYGFNGFDFPGEYQAMAFMIFNPLTTVPASTDDIGTAHGGDKMAHCWAATTPPNNDWMISQMFTVGNGAFVGFWARSLTADYGLERFKVGVSSGGTAPANFTVISPGAYVQAPVDWTYFEYDIPVTFIPGDVRIGINCVSNDAFIFMVDDFVMDLGQTANDDPTPVIINTALNGNFPNPFNPETSISYSVKGNLPVVVEVYNTKGQRVKTLVNETKATGNYNVKWDGTDDNNHRVTSGVYFYKMKAGTYTSSRKMIMMK